MPSRQQTVMQKEKVVNRVTQTNETCSERPKCWMGKSDLSLLSIDSVGKYQRYADGGGVAIDKIGGGEEFL